MLCSHSNPYSYPIPIPISLGILWEFIPIGTPIPMHTSTLAIMSIESDVLREIDFTAIMHEWLLCSKIEKGVWSLALDFVSLCASCRYMRDYYNNISIILLILNYALYY